MASALRGKLCPEAGNPFRFPHSELQLGHLGRHNRRKDLTCGQDPSPRRESYRETYRGLLYRSRPLKHRRVDCLCRSRRAGSGHLFLFLEALPFHRRPNTRCCPRFLRHVGPEFHREKTDLVHRRRIGQSHNRSGKLHRLREQWLRDSSGLAELSKINFRKIPWSCAKSLQSHGDSK